MKKLGTVGLHQIMEVVMKNTKKAALIKNKSISSRIIYLMIDFNESW